MANQANHLTTANQETRLKYWFSGIKVKNQVACDKNDHNFDSKMGATAKEANLETIKRPGVEMTNGNPDIKETFAWGQGLLRGSISTWYHGPNLIPDDLTDIQNTFDSYCSKMKEIGLSLLQAFEDAFDIPGCLVTKFSQALE